MTLTKFLYAPHIFTRREKRIFLLILIIVVVTGALLFSRIYRRITSEVPAIAGTYIEGMLREPRAISPIYSSVNDTDRDIARLIYSSVLKYRGDGSLEGDLAESWEISDDNKVYTIKLRENIKWHDGETLNADDILFTVQTIQQPQYNSPLRVNWQGVIAKAIDSHTVVFSLHAPYAPFIENLTVGILPKHLWEGILPEQTLLHELNLKPIGSGPYQFNKFQQDKDGRILSYTVQRNPEYHREGPYLEKIKFIFFQNEESRISAWKTGTIDGFGPISHTLDTSEISPETASIHELMMPRIFGIFFNTQESEILDDIAIRTAIAHAINRSAIAELASSKSITTTDSYLPSLIEQNTVLAYPFDRDLASSILTDAGWTDADEDGIVEKIISKEKGASPTPLSVSIATSDAPELLAVAKIIKEQLLNIGIDIKIKTLSFADLESQVIRPRKYELLLFGQAYGQEPDPFAFWHSSQIKDPGLNVALFANNKADRILEEIRRTTDPFTLSAKYEELQPLFMEDIPAIFLFSQKYLYMLPTSISGVNLARIALPADRFNEIHKWYLRTRRAFR